MVGTTERSGHILDRDSRTAKMIDVGVRIIKRCLERMREKHEIVELINAPGNHDETFAHFLNVLFRNLYANENRVIVHDAPTTRHYLQHGKCLIGVVHGAPDEGSGSPRDHGRRRSPRSGVRQSIAYSFADTTTMIHGSNTTGASSRW